MTSGKGGYQASRYNSEDAGCQKQRLVDRSGHVISSVWFTLNCDPLLDLFPHTGTKWRKLQQCLYKKRRTRQVVVGVRWPN
jgi:hypothetical protein